LLCHDFNFGLATKVKVLEGKWVQENVLELKHIYTNVKKCKQVNPYSSKWTLTLQVGVL